MIGVFGGTFDPIHHGHLRLALELQERLRLERVHLIPSASPPHRESPGASAQQRLALLRAALAGETSLLADPRELERDGPSYSVDTLLSLRAEYGPQRPLCLLLGMDAVLGLPTWHQWQRLVELAHLVLVRRPGTLQPLPPLLEQFLLRHRLPQREQLRQTPAGGVWVEEIPALSISATEIRAILRRAGNPRYLLPDSVLQMIRSEGLYRDSEGD